VPNASCLDSSPHSSNELFSVFLQRGACHCKLQSPVCWRTALPAQSGWPHKIKTSDHRRIGSAGRCVKSLARGQKMICVHQDSECECWNVPFAHADVMQGRGEGSSASNTYHTSIAFGQSENSQNSWGRPAQLECCRTGCWAALEGGRKSSTALRFQPVLKNGKTVLLEGDGPFMEHSSVGVTSRHRT